MEHNPDIQLPEAQSVDVVLKYFPEFSEEQREQMRLLGELYPEWNEKINVISRKDIQNLYPNHVLHSLAIAKFLPDLPEGYTLLDMGTGGGFPGIPLAILFPDTRFRLVDSIGKKLKVAAGVAQSIGLKNVSVCHERAEDEKGRFDFVVSRAVMPLPDLMKIIGKNIRKEQQNALPNGLICLKGGELQQEVQPFKHKATLWNLSEFFEEEFFETKKIVYVPM